MKRCNPLIKPSPEAVKDWKRKLKGIWRKHVGSPTVALINEMNPVIRGWSNYFRIGMAKEVFSDGRGKRGRNRPGKRFGSSGR